MNRCISYTKNKKKCRAKTDKFFCCASHEPLNSDLLVDGCFICMENIDKSSDILFLRCRHVFHKKCFFEWSSSYSTYEEFVCLLCRNPCFHLKKKEKEEVIKTVNIIELKKLEHILEIKIV